MNTLLRHWKNKKTRIHLHLLVSMLCPDLGSENGKSIVCLPGSDRERTLAKQIHCRAPP